MHKNSAIKTSLVSSIFNMDDATWARHSNPISVWSRVVTGLPIFYGSIWSVNIIGYWSIVSIGIACLWLWLNPRLFPVPNQTNNWASKVTFGERIWLDRSNHKIPKHHANWAMFLSLLSGISFMLGVYGAYSNDISLTFCFGALSLVTKMWFCDRMVWLYEDTLSANNL